MYIVNNLINYILNMKFKVKVLELLKQETFFIKLYNHKLKQVIHIYFIKMPVIVNQINKILVQLNQVIYVVKLFNIHHLMKLQFVI
jgi:hypothetical protein